VLEDPVVVLERGLLVISDIPSEGGLFLRGDWETEFLVGVNPDLIPLSAFRSPVAGEVATTG
jgi:hypothetical protein